MPTKRACVIESAICCTHVDVVSEFRLIKPYEINLSIDPNAMPVTGPVVSSDLIISRNGDKNVLESMSLRSECSFKSVFNS